MFKYKINFDGDALKAVAIENADYLQSKLDSVRSALQSQILYLAVKEGESITTLVISSEKSPLENMTYALEGTPCSNIENNKVCVYPTSVMQRFPQDKLLQDIGFDGYMGAPIINEDSTVVGIVVALFDFIDEPIPLKTQFFSNFAEQLSLYIQKCHLDKRTGSHLSLLNEVQSISKTGAWEFHNEANQVFWSDEIYAIYGVPKGRELSPEEAINFYAPAARDTIKDAFINLLKDAEPYNLELEFADAAGNAKWVRTTGKAELDANGNLLRVFGAFEDITEQKLLSIQTLEYADKLENILNNLNDAVITINSHGIMLQCNDVAVRMFGYSRAEMLGSNVAMIMPEPYAAKHDSYMRHYESTGEAKIIGVGRQLPAMRKNGDIFQMELSLTETSQNGEKQYIGLVRDISERIEAEDAIYNLAFTDNVTNLRNSQWFEREAKEHMFKAIRQGHYVHALLLDIDKMASFNHRFGFHNGDKALKQVADKLKAIIGQDYAIFKYDADSFVILSYKTASKTDLYSFNSKLIESALLHSDNYRVDIGGTTYSLSGSLGSAIFNPAEHSFEAMLSVLEHAVMRAKNDAPFGLCHIAKDGIDEYDKYIAIRDRVQTVANRGELSLALQPQFNANEEIIAFEALIRWHSAEFGWVSPADFIPIAEETGAIFSIGEWVIEAACDALTEIMSEGICSKVSINISARQIVAPEFAQFLTRTTKEKGIPPQVLMLELTETALVSDMSLVRKTMLELAELGFQFSVDDFGTGYSSLAYLKELPISELKIDKYFVDDIVDDALDKEYVIVDAIINMAKALGVSCIAEGVENEIQRNYLNRSGCNIFQGYYFSKPLNEKDWKQLLKTGTFSSSLH